MYLQLLFFATIDTVAAAILPLCRPIPYPVLSMYSLRLNCSVGSSISSATIGILAVAVVAPLVKVAVYRPGVKSAPAAIGQYQYCKCKSVFYNMYIVYTYIQYLQE